MEISRVRDVYQRHGERFLERCFTKMEREYCLLFSDPAPALAARFAAKEAVSKMLGVGIGEELSWLDIEVAREENGRPRLQLPDRVRSKFEIRDLSLSMSHSRDYAIAMAVCTRGEM